MKVSDYIVQFLSVLGVDKIYGLQGGAITHIVDSIERNDKIQFIPVYHEQTAAIAAEGYARESKNLGVAIATSGPGATNLITGIANAFFDSIPVLYITGQVNTYEFKYDKSVRQQGFQETNIVEIVKPITKYAKVVDRVEDIKEALEKAVEIALSKRMGPVLIDIPMDVQRGDISIPENKTIVKKPLNSVYQVGTYKNDQIEYYSELINNAVSPVILLGGGARSSNQELIESFVEMTQIPVVVTLMGKGLFDEFNTLFCGMIGSYGNRCANMIIANADVVIALGSRLDTRQTGTNIKSFVESGKILHIDIDQNELDGNRLENRLSIKMSIDDFIQDVQVARNTRDNWLKYVLPTVNKYNQKQELARNQVYDFPYKLVEQLNHMSHKIDAYCVDIGHHQMIAAQILTLNKEQEFYTSGGHAPMGYAIPAAVGVAMASPNKQIIAIVGDGCFHISTQALMLISQYQLSIKIIVINNHSLGMITQFQNQYFDGVLSGTVKEKGYLVPDLESIANAYALKYISISDKETIPSQASKLSEFINSKGNGILEARCSELTTVIPKLSVGSPIENPYPQLPEAILKKAMFR